MGQGSGYASKDIRWDYDGGTLTISGKGDIPEFDTHQDQGFALYGTKAVTTATWGTWWDCVSRVVIEAGITGLGQKSFVGFDYIESVTIPDTVTDISALRWHGSSYNPCPIKDIYYGGTAEQ